MTDLASYCSACGATYREQLANCPNCQAPIAPEGPKPGEVFDEKYEIVGRVGAGGMGEVFKARHVHLGSIRAIKVMNRTLSSDDASRRRFSREARLATGIHHPNIAAVYDFAVAANGSDYIVSEFVEGTTLRQWISSSNNDSPEAVLDIALQTLEGIDYLHRAGILHRDISPENIMIATDENSRIVVKIIDLGLAKLLATEPRGGDSTTRAGLFLGNPRYSSPEQLGALPDGAEIDARSDLYSFGVVLFEMLSGIPPFASATPHGYAAKHLTERPPRLSARPGARPIPRALEQIVWKALEKKRELRYGSAREMADALMLASDEPEPLEAPELPPPAMPRPPLTSVEPLSTPRAKAKSPRTRMLVVAIAGAAVIVTTIAVSLVRVDDEAPVRNITTAATTTTPVASSVPQQAAIAAPAAGLTGKLIVDARPSGRIISIHDGTKEWITAGAIHTPHTLELPIGTYSVAMLGPDGTQQSAVVDVTSTEPARVSVDFHDCGGCTANNTP